jgi:hypothetical protein
MKAHSFKKLILVFPFIFLTLTFLNAQTEVEDYAAMNFKSKGPYLAASFDKDNFVCIAKTTQVEGDTFLEIGKFDDEGTYTRKMLLQLPGSFNSIKAKFAPMCSKIALQLNYEGDIKLAVYDLNSGILIADDIGSDIEDQSNFDFFFTPSANLVAIVNTNDTYLYELTEGAPLIAFPNNRLIKFSGDGNTLFCKGKDNRINYINIKTGAVVRSYSLTDYKRLYFDDKGEMVVSYVPNNRLNVYKYCQDGMYDVKYYYNIAVEPEFSPTLSYILIDDNVGGKRLLFNSAGENLYEARIEPYDRTLCYTEFSTDEKKLIKLTEKYLYLYDFELMRHYKTLANKHTELFKFTGFMIDEEIQLKAKRIKEQKKALLSMLTGDFLAMEGELINRQKNSLGVIELKIKSIGAYDYNSQTIDVAIDIPVSYTSTRTIIGKVRIPKLEADIFIKNWPTLKVTALRQAGKNPNSVYVFNVLIDNGMNSGFYRAITHRTLPINNLSFEEQFEIGSKASVYGNWYEAIVNLSDYPDNFSKNDVANSIRQRALISYFEDKWKMVKGTTITNKNFEELLIYLSDFPKDFAYINDVNDYRQTVIDFIFSAKVDTVKMMMGDGNYSDALDYIDKSFPNTYTDIYSGKVLEFSNYKELQPLKNDILFNVAKRSMQGTNWQRAKEMLERITDDYQNYDEVKKLLSEVNYQLGK